MNDHEQSEFAKLLDPFEYVVERPVPANWLDEWGDPLPGYEWLDED
ncbi:MAG: hypothetical protein AAF674_12725 [Pseudomonadota bacterium]